MRNAARGIALLLVLTAGCDDINIEVGGGDTVTGSGVMVTRSFEFTDFDALEFGHAFSAEVTRGDRFNVSITIDDNLLDRLEAGQQDRTVAIGLERSTSTRRATLEVRITMPLLARLELGGASHARLEGFDDAGELIVHVSEASVVSGALRAERVDFDVSGASRIELTGAATRASLRGSGASSFTLRSFTLRECTVDLSGASSAEVTVTEDISAVDLSGASRLVYYGSPTLGRTITSGGSMINGR